jgi:RimJ/RimL family protein N-acetyltransferase
MRYVLTGKPLTPEQAVEVHQWLLNAAKPIRGLGCWVGFVGDDFVGWWVLAPSQMNTGKDGPAEYNQQRAEFGWRLLPKFWRKGYAKEGSRELLRYAFQDLGLKEVAGDTMAVNVASRATMASCGLQHIRTFYNKYEDAIPGIEEGEVEYKITKDEWTRLQSPGSTDHHGHNIERGSKLLGTAEVAQ